MRFFAGSEHLGQVAHLDNGFRAHWRRHSLTRIGAVDSWFGVRQTLRVLVTRRGQDLVDGTFFDDLAVFHDDDVIAELTRERQVVGDQHERHRVIVM